MPKKIIFTQDEVDLIIRLNDSLSIKKIAKELKVCDVTIRKQLKSMGLIHKPNKNRHQKHNANMKEILKMNDPDIIYCLGFLWGDGHLPKNRETYSRIVTNIVKTDFDDLKKSFEKLGTAKTYNVQQKHWQLQTSWVLGDVDLAKFLFDLDYHIKSYVCPKKVLSMIPICLHHYWWRGFFDADGHLSLRGKIPKQIFFGGQIKYTWEYPMAFMAKMGVIFHVDEKYSKTGNCSLFSCYRQYDMMKFLNYIYSGVELDNIGLTRKREKFLLIKDFEPHIKTSAHKNIMLSRVGRTDKKRWFFTIRKNGKNVIKIGFETEGEAIEYKQSYFLQKNDTSSALTATIPDRETATADATLA